MNWLEARFRKRFEPRGDGFLYRRFDCDVMLEPEDVEHLMAEWRQGWLNPLLWAALLLAAGAIATALTYKPSWALLLWIAAVILLTICGYWFEAPYRSTREVAEMLEPVGPGHGRPSYWPNPGWTIMLACFLFFETDWNIVSFFFIGILIAALIGDAVYKYWKSLRHPARRALVQGKAR